MLCLDFCSTPAEALPVGVSDRFVALFAGTVFAYVTEDEWEYVKKLAIANYPELNWEAGGYGDYEQFDIICKDKRK